MSTSYYFPEEILFIILSWLPVKSLVRFSSVCKSWRTIISNKQFILIHLDNSKKKSSSVLHYPMLRKDSEHARSIVYLRNREDSFKLHLPPQCNEHVYKICSCNGLVCFCYIGSNHLCLWNPATRQFKILPEPNKNKPSYSYRNCLGFGFDSVSNDYKILRIVSSGVSFVTEAELYSANTDSWKEIEVPRTLQSPGTFQYEKCVCTKTGVLYWKSDHGLMSFDLHNEVFGLYPYHDSTGLRSHIFEFEGSAAMIYKSVDDNGSVSTLWVLDDICGKLSWTEKFNLEDDFVLLYLGVGQYVARIDGEYIFKEYGYGKKETKKFSPVFPRRTNVLSSIIKYTESLVSLEGFKPQE